jgi:hypothetical protein
MEVTRDREARTLKLVKKKLTGELLARYGMEAAKGKSVPIIADDQAPLQVC